MSKEARELEVVQRLVLVLEPLMLSPNDVAVEQEVQELGVIREEVARSLLAHQEGGLMSYHLVGVKQLALLKAQHGVVLEVLKVTLKHSGALR